MPEEPRRPLKVFLCHAHSDKSSVRDLYLHLTKDGVDAWLDKEKLLPGQDWELEIRKAVREADVVVVCLSKQFNQAGFRQKEVRLALDTAMEQPEGEIFIIPARLEECDNLESLRKWHWVDLFEDDGYERLMRALRARADKIGVTLRIRKSRTPKPKKPNESIALDKDVKSSQEKRVFYNLTAHYECDFENTTVETLTSFLYESLTGIIRTVTGIDKIDNSRTAEYQTGKVEYLDPKDGKTTQHALIVHGKKVRSMGKRSLQDGERLALVSEMLIITVIQGVNSSSLRFDSNELPSDAFKHLIEWILADIGKSVTVQLTDTGVEKISSPKHEQPEIGIAERLKEDTTSGTLNTGGDITGGVIVTGSNNVINFGKRDTIPSETPKGGKAETRKTKSRSKPHTAITVALIGFVGTIIAGLLSSPLIGNLFASTPTITPSQTIEPSQTPTILPTFTRTKTNTPTVTPTSTTIPPESFLLQEDFEDGLANKWSQCKGNWKIEEEPNGNHYWSVAGSEAQDDSCWYETKPLDWTDYAFESRIKFVDAVNGEFRLLGLYVHATAGTFYGLFINDFRSLSYFWDIPLIGYGSLGEPDTPFVFERNRWYIVRLEIKGKQLSTYIDNNLVRSRDLATLDIEQGAVALDPRSGKYYFDDIKVWSLR